MAQESHKIFVDSSFFIAFIDRGDLNHTKCVPVFEFLGKHNYQVYTTSLVLIQVFNRIDKELGTTISLEFLQAIMESNIEVLFPSKSEFLSAYRLLKNDPNIQVSMSELLNSILMEKNGVSAVLTYDSWVGILGTRKSQYTS